MSSAISKAFDEYLDEQMVKLGRHLGVSPRKAEEVVAKLAHAMDVPFGTAFVTKPGIGFAKSGKRFFTSGWLERKNRRGESTRLHLCHVIDHVLGVRALAVQSPRRTRIVTIDLDTKTPARRRDLTKRIAAVKRALQNAPHLTLRSSESGGVHLRYFLKKRYHRDRLRVIVVQALHRAGITPKPGYVEVFPSGKAKLRLPLGKGSLILEDEKLLPVAIGGATEQWEAFFKLTKKRRVDLKQLVGTATAPATESPVRSKIVADGQRWTGLPGFPKFKGKDYWDALKKCEKGVSDYGRRYSEHCLRLWDAVIRRGLSRRAALREHKEWLVSGHHKSRDLKRDPEGTRRRMLKDAEAKVDLLLAYRKDHPDSIARSHYPSSTSPSPSSKRKTLRSTLNTYLQSAQHRAVKVGLGWRDYVGGCLTPTDRRQIDSIGNQWLTPRLEVFRGLLRFGHRKSGSSPDIALNWQALQKIAGGRPVPEELMRVASKRKGARGRTAYPELVRSARRLGWIRLLKPAIVGSRSRIYEVRFRDHARRPR